MCMYVYIFLYLSYVPPGMIRVTSRRALSEARERVRERVFNGVLLIIAVWV